MGTQETAGARDLCSTFLLPEDHVAPCISEEYRCLDPYFVGRNSFEFSLVMNESTNRFATLLSSNIFAHPTHRVFFENPRTC